MTVTDEDYMLGIADLTGELMRYGINNAGITGKVRECAEVVRSIKDGEPPSPNPSHHASGNADTNSPHPRAENTEMDPLTSNARYLRPKLEVMANCLRKLEDGK